MNEHQFEVVFTRFLNEYWGAFHELLEAESVKPDRLADSLLNDVVDQHAEFMAVCPEQARATLDTLGQLWRQAAAHRELVPDDPLTADQIRLALGGFRTIHDTLDTLGGRYPSARSRVLKGAVHGTPNMPLRADPAF